jgi:MATE family multidrug resistance protein
MRSGPAGTAAAVAPSLSLVPRFGLPGAAMLASVSINACVAHVSLRRVPVLAGRPLRLGRPRFGEVFRFARVGIPLAGTEPTYGTPRRSSRSAWVCTGLHGSA